MFSEITLKYFNTNPFNKLFRLDYVATITSSSDRAPLSEMLEGCSYKNSHVRVESRRNKKVVYVCVSAKYRARLCHSGSIFSVVAFRQLFDK